MRMTILVVCVFAASALPASRCWAAPDALAVRADFDTAGHLADAVTRTPPFSFTLDGKPSSTLLGGWATQTHEKQLDADRTQITTTWKEPGGLTARMVAVRYHDLPAIEWTAYLKNEGTADTKVIADLRGIDMKIGAADAKPGSAKRKSWDLARDFPEQPSGGAIELYRGWFGSFRPLDPEASKGDQRRFGTAGDAPWVAADASPGGSVTLMPAQGIEGASDAPASGKSPAIAFNVPANGVYRVTGSLTHVGAGGDGLDWFLGDSDGRIYGTGPVDTGKTSAFDQRVFLIAGQKLYLAAHSRSDPTGDQCRVKFNVTQLTDVVDGDVVLHTNKGADARDTDYEPLAIGLGADETVALASWGGRPSDAVAVPFFNVQMPQASAIVAIGWPGQWDATFSRKGEDVRLSAGQEKVRTILRPGEEIRTPLMAIVNYTGDDVQRGQNLWRRWMVAHNLPRVNGKIIGPIVAANSSHEFAEMIKANEANQIAYNDRYQEERIKLDYWWMDAGWYFNDGTWVNTGTWKVDTNRFPRGLRAISDHISSYDVKSIVWFEPERVTRKTELYDEHPDFLLSGEMNLMDPSAGMVFLRGAMGPSEPCIGFNPTDRERHAGMVRWEPKQFTMHPGPNGEYAVTRFTAPADGTYRVHATFRGADPRATTDVHVLAGAKPLFDAQVTPKVSRDYRGSATLKQGDTLSFVVGRGPNDYTCDTTALALQITGPDGQQYDVAKEFKADARPNGAWTYGAMPAGPVAGGDRFVAMDRSEDAGLGWKLLNLGNPAARAWITDRVDGLIKSERVALYRQDFNIEPLNYWRNADAPDRQGMTENLYVQGYLAYWDALVERNPGLWIDTCASGGRRNDLETLRRATPLLRSDRLFAPEGQQIHTYGISQWMPANGTAQLVGKSAIFGDMVGGVDPYVLRSCMSATLNLCIDISERKLDYDTLRTFVAQHREVGDSYFGDYYPLTPASTKSDVWVAWQFHDAAKDDGFVQAFRRKDATEQTSVQLHGLDPAAGYRIWDLDRAGEAKTLTGAALARGYQVRINTQPGAAILRYQRQR